MLVQSALRFAYLHYTLFGYNCAALHFSMLSYAILGCASLRLDVTLLSFAEPGFTELNSTVPVSALIYFNSVMLYLP